MKQEEKDLLLRDLSARLPYGVKLQLNNTVTTIRLEDINYEDGECTIWSKGCDYSLDEVKPYLRQRLSMTEKEKKEEINLLKEIAKKQFDGIDEYYKYYDWLRSKQFNINLPDGLYIEVTESNNPYKY